MTKRRKDDLSPSLFPFLSILASVIGVLILTICGSVVGQLGAGDAAAIIAYGDIEKKTKASDDQMQRLRKLIAEAEEIRHRIRQLQEQEEQLRGIADSKRTRNELLDEKDQIQENIGLVEEEIERLKKLIARADDALRERSIRIGPAGGGKDLTPRFVECNKDGLAIITDHPTAGRITKTRVAGRNISNKFNAFGKLIKEVKRNKKLNIVFLIRPDVVKTYEEAQEEVAKAGVSYGPMPIPGHGQLDLSFWFAPQQTRLLEDGQKLLAAEKHVRARDLLRKLKTEHPRTKEGRRAAALLTSMENDPAIRAVLRDHDRETREREGADWCRSQFNLAGNFVLNKMYAQARRVLKGIIRKYPDTKWATTAKRELEKIDERK